MTTVAAEMVPTSNPQNAEPTVDGAVFTVNLPNFSGPFDLLLTLITRRQLDITDIALAEVTDEFIAYISQRFPLGTPALEEASEFLVTAATLLELKTLRLLPTHREPTEADVALLEARDLLFARLLQYRAYRQVADIFASRWAAEAQRFARTVSLEEKFAKALPELVFEVGVEEFASIAAAAFARAENADNRNQKEPEQLVQELSEHLHSSVTTIAEQERFVLDTLSAAPGEPMDFTTLVRGAGSVQVAVVRFLALLELYKDGAVQLNQEQSLGQLRVSAGERFEVRAAGFFTREDYESYLAERGVNEGNDSAESNAENNEESEGEYR